MKHFRIAMALTLILCLFASFTAIQAAEPTEDEILNTVYQYDKAINWGTQDNNNYYFMYLDSDKTFKEMTFDNLSNAFYGPYYPDYSEHPEYQHLSITIDPVVHPAQNASPVIAFRCDYTGTVKCTMNIRAGSPWVDGTDPTALTVYKNAVDTIVYPLNDDGYVLTENPGVDYEFTADVKAGDMLYITIDKYLTIGGDSTAFDAIPAIQYIALSNGSEEPDQPSTPESPDTVDALTAVMLCATVTGGVALAVKRKKIR